MELLEYQAKSLLLRFHVPSPSHYLIERGVDVKKEVQRLGIGKAVVRPQEIGLSEEWVSETQEELIESITKALKDRSKILVMPWIEIEKSWSLHISITPSVEVLVRICNDQSGKVAEEHVVSGKLWDFQVHRLTGPLQIPYETEFRELLAGALRAFFQLDILTLEILLIVTSSGLFEAMKAKMTIDDAALFRQPEIMREKEKLLPSTTFMTFPGSVACIANGYGLVKATADIVQGSGVALGPLYNIEEVISEKSLLTTIRTADMCDKVQNIFVNIFTGIQDGERIAMALVEAFQQERPRHTIVFRIEGTNALGARRLLEPWCRTPTSLQEAEKMLRESLPSSPRPSIERSPKKVKKDANLS